MASALSDADATFELELQANPFALNVWLAFLDTQRAPRARLSLYERALAHLPGSYKLWRTYLGEAVKMVRGRARERARAAARAPQTLLTPRPPPRPPPAGGAAPRRRRARRGRERAL